MTIMMMANPPELGRWFVSGYSTTGREDAPIVIPVHTIVGFVDNTARLGM